MTEGGRLLESIALTTATNSGVALESFERLESTSEEVYRVMLRADGPVPMYVGETLEADLVASKHLLMVAADRIRRAAEVVKAAATT